MRGFGSNQGLLNHILSGKDLSWENDDAEDVRTKKKVACLQIFLNDDEQEQGYTVKVIDSGKFHREQK